MKLVAAIFAAASLVFAHHHAHSPYTPNPGAARYWVARYFGHGWQARLMLCVAYTESRYELAATNGDNVGPWQVNLQAHPWVNGSKIRRSWRYATAVAWHLSGYGTNFHAWVPDCGIN